MGETSFFERIVVVQTLGATLNNGLNYGRRRSSTSNILSAQSDVWRAKIHVRDHRGRVLSELLLGIQRIRKNPENSREIFFQEYITNSRGWIAISDLNESEMTRAGLQVVVNNDILRPKRIFVRKDGERSRLLVGELHFKKEEMRYYGLL